MFTGIYDGNNLAGSIDEFKAFLTINHAVRAYSPYYADIAGGNIEAAQFLAQLIHWCSPDKSGRSRMRIVKDGYEWVAKTANEWQSEIRISRYQERSIRILLASPHETNKGQFAGYSRGPLIEWRKWKFGGRPVIHYRMLWENLFEAMRQISLINARSIQESEEIPIIEKLNNGLSRNSTIHYEETKQSLTKITAKTTAKKNSSIPQISEKTEISRVLSENGIWESLIEEINGNLTGEEIQAAVYMGRAKTEDDPAPYIVKLLRIWINDELARNHGVEMARHVWHCGVCDRFNYRVSACHGFDRQHIEDWEWVIPRETE